jgi:tripartite ATP-independent transporter DctP family solute receptor
MPLLPADFPFNGRRFFLFQFEEGRPMMKKTLLLVLVFLLVGALGATAANKLIDEALQKEKPVTMTIAHPEPPDPLNFIHAAALDFKNYVESESKGKITVKLAPGGQLGDSAEMPKQIQMGAIEGSMSMAEGHVAPYYKGIQVLAIPYLFISEDHALFTLDPERPFGKKLWADLEAKTGLKVLTIWDNGGFRCFTNNKRPIKSPEDMKGLKIRTMQIPAHMEMVKSLGANPTPIAWTELYNALQLNVVDGQENAVPTIALGRINEVQKYLTLDRHVYSNHIFPVNAKWYGGLPPVYQLIIQQGALEASETARRMTRIQRATLLADFRKGGMEIYDPSPAELAMFREKAQAPVLQFIRKEVGDQLVDDLLKASEQSLKDLGYVK